MSPAGRAQVGFAVVLVWVIRTVSAASGARFGSSFDADLASARVDPANRTRLPPGTDFPVGLNEGPAKNEVGDYFFLAEESARGSGSGVRSSSTERTLSRSRRYVVFPHGSSIQLVIEFTTQVRVPFAGNIFTSTVSYGLAWRLPTHAQEIYLSKRAAGEDPDLPHRARLVNDLSVFLDKLGLHGEVCARRTLCELNRRRNVKGGFMEEIMKSLFTVSGGVESDADYNQCKIQSSHCPFVLDVPIHRHAFDFM